MLYGTIFHPRLTSRGRQIVESGLSAFSPERDRAANVTNNNQVTITGSNGVNVAQQSHHSQQSIAMTSEQIKMVQDKAEALRRIIEADTFEASDELKEQAGAVLREIEAEASSSEPKSGKMKELFGKLKELVVSLGSQILVVTASGMLDEAIASL